MVPSILGISADPYQGAERSRLALESATLAIIAGDPLEAERILRTHIVQVPGDAEALSKLAELAVSDHRIDEATLLLRRAAAADPSATRHFALARHLLAVCGPSASLAHIRAMPETIRRTFELEAFEALLLGMLGKHRLQLSMYERLTARRPGDPVLLINMATALNAVGRVDEAVAALRRAIRLQPTSGEAYWALANLKTYSFSNADVRAIRGALCGDLQKSERLHFEFALGAALEQRGDFAESFEHYSAGNRIRTETLSPEQMRVTAFVDEMIETFGQDMFKRNAGAGLDTEDPIFIVGLHRSGSTLVEQILASHSAVEGAGELPVMQQIWERITLAGARCGRSAFDQVKSLTLADFSAIGSEYIELTRPFRSKKRRFVDKLPANWLNIGLIRLALPNARIIDVRRNPMACGFSNFKQLYAAGVYYTYSLASIGYFYQDYLRLMNHFDAIQPGVIHHLVYERLVECPEREIRRALDYLNLPFEGACLNFNRNERDVRTPSAQQVRRPINTDGLAAWRPYEAWLGPLEEALGPALDTWRPFEARS